MKKVIFGICSLFLIYTFISCRTLDKSTYKRKTEADIGMIKNATPENSCLVYGFCADSGQLVYTDVDREWKAEVIISGPFSLPPAHKGATLILEDSYVEFRRGNLIYRGNAKGEWNVKIPKGKSLYYMGFHSFANENLNTFDGIAELMSTPGTLVLFMPKTEEEFVIFTYKNELKCLKSLQKQYKGTVWSKVIDARIAELNELLKK